ncbi:hypothetical protein [Achromobacter phage Motura]|uniref:Uncharacterized protein n=1 Tax=Achromobacter phage Motura TaxID=2591403 RepID=A0A514CSV3_9CAUD|nr:hypothetical protein H1O15_gp248 [Achromobacter phage Motura]QDH83540.1 hypothetical protein [Achromobacter phage Motura]
MTRPASAISNAQRRCSTSSLLFCNPSGLRALLSFLCGAFQMSIKSNCIELQTLMNAQAYLRTGGELTQSMEAELTPCLQKIEGAVAMWERMEGVHPEMSELIAALVDNKVWVSSAKPDDVMVISFATLQNVVAKFAQDRNPEHRDLGFDTKIGGVPLSAKNSVGYALRVANKLIDDAYQGNEPG